MDIFNALSMIGGLCLFLFGMNLMGQALERRAGGKMHSVLTKMTTRKFAGFMTGCGVTAVIQSSSATTVMVVGFVNAGVMALSQAVTIIKDNNKPSICEFFPDSPELLFLCIGVVFGTLCIE